MSAPNACLNCGAELTGEYCASCGQRKVAREQDLTLREFLEDTTQELAHWEGKVPQTLKTLFLEPGRLTLDFLAGRRARWIPPLRLYLICSVVYFLLSAFSESITHRADRQLDEMFVTNADGTKSVTHEARVEIAQGLPGRLFGYEKMEYALLNGAQFQRTIDTVYSKSMFVLLPLFALLTNLAWRRKVPRYPAHLYFALHLYAAWFGALAVTTLATLFAKSPIVLGTAGGIAVVYGAIYGLLALKRVFGDSWPRTIGKAAAVAIVYMAGLFGASLVVMAITLALI
ncbi:MAG TPA: DUF3667 domain-containing protein [Gemmatimonadaceae bacterium]|jgi:hypothetical protein|nr:DUF3667 domain-containing protein [Gemmatimonadaceae bacterium]